MRSTSSSDTPRPYLSPQDRDTGGLQGSAASRAPDKHQPAVRSLRPSGPEERPRRRGPSRGGRARLPRPLRALQGLPARQASDCGPGRVLSLPSPRCLRALPTEG